MITIVDYGAGNLVSVKKALDWLGEQNEITADPKRVAAAARIVLPGVGHFASTAALGRSGLQSAIHRAVQRGVPFLGICVGMQWMFERSQESDGTAGLGLFPGECERFPAGVKSPHVGWNQLQLSGSSRVFGKIPSPSFVYFSHSYRVPLSAATVASCDYGGTFSAAVEQDNIFGVQFHPEKSGQAGLQLLKNFCAI